MTLNIPIHKNILLAILKDIYSDVSIASNLGFKGGTAAYLFYNLGRFSVDLDFDLLSETKENYIFSKVEAIAKKYGQLKEVRKKRFNLFFFLSYEEKSQNIKIEINRREFGSHYELKTYLGISMLVMVKDDMFAHKLMAMYERMGKVNRDLFDVWYFLKNNWPLNKAIVEKRSNMSLNDFLQKCIENLKNIASRGILAGMGELLDEKQKIWAKENLKKDLLFLLRVMLDNEK